MYIPLPLLIVIGVIILALLLWALKRGGSGGTEISVDRRAMPDPSASRSASNPAPAPVSFNAKGDVNDFPEAMMPELERLLQKRSKIYAVKLVRDQTGCGLAEAKHYVDALSARMGL